MNQKKKTFLLLLIVSTLTATLCFAQSEVGQGGDAVLKNGKYYLLDLVEAGIETTAALPPSYTGCSLANPDLSNGVCQWYNGISQYADVFGKDVNQGLLNALTNLPDLDALSILKTIGLFDWNFVSIPLVDIRDVNTPIDLSTYPLYQLATRKDHTITINALIWNQMDLVNKVALITHEALYAMVRPVADPAHPGMFAQDSYAARQFNYKIYQNQPNCTGCLPALLFSQPRLRTEFTDNEYTFTPYSTAFGSYGAADDFIGNNVNDVGSMEAERYISSEAYIKLEGALQTLSLPGEPSQTIVRIKYVFFKDSAKDFCAQLFTNTGTYHVKISLVRTLFTMELSSYASNTGDSNSVSFSTSEMPFSKWYESQIGVGKDSLEINTSDQSVCEQQISSLAPQFETLMHLAPDYISRWDDAH